jgi:hypothetical protein
LEIIALLQAHHADAAVLMRREGEVFFPGGERKGRKRPQGRKRKSGDRQITGFQRYQ